MPNQMKTDWSLFFQNIGCEIKNIDLLTEALTHTSTAKKNHGQSYERLEFLGDRVLGLVIADTLYRYFPNEDEGKLAKRHAQLVRKSSLVQVARNIHLENYIIMAHGEQKTGGQQKESLLADSCEALIAALYLDGGFEQAKEFVLGNWMPMISDMHDVPQDSKSRLQEWAQGRGYKTPYYTVLLREGPDHAPHFTIRVIVEGYGESDGKGASKRIAEQNAAQELLKKVINDE